MNWNKLKEDGIIVNAMLKLIMSLEQISLFQAVRNISFCVWALRNKKALKGKSCNEKMQLYKDTKPFTNSYLFPELWVIGNIICGLIIYYSIAMSLISYTWGYFFVVLAMLRAFEIMVYHLKVLIFDQLRNRAQNKEYAIKSTTRMLILLLCNMFEYVLCFAIVYQFALPVDAGMNFMHSFVLSISAFFNTNFVSIDNLSPKLLIFIRVETILGVFMNLICIARFINMLPGLRSIETY